MEKKEKINAWGGEQQSDRHTHRGVHAKKALCSTHNINISIIALPVGGASESYAIGWRQVKVAKALSCRVMMEHRHSACFKTELNLHEIELSNKTVCSFSPSNPSLSLPVPVAWRILKLTWTGFEILVKIPITVKMIKYVHGNAWCTRHSQSVWS